MNVYEEADEANRKALEERLAADKAHLAELEKTRILSACYSDPVVIAFKARRAEQANQLRYWAKLGHELPKTRKISGIITQS